MKELTVIKRIQVIKKNKTGEFVNRFTVKCINLNNLEQDTPLK